MPLPAGTRLGPYVIAGPVGHGGMGQVYGANDERLGRRVAIKVLSEPLVADAEALARFEREARAIGALSHPNVVVVHDVGAEGSTHYVVMELLEGETLRARLNTAGPAGLPIRKALEIAIQVANGLAAAHAKGIAHRDLKPENIFLTTEGRVKIVDFGLARLSPALAASDAQTTDLGAGLQTAPGIVWGTAGYLAPEQLRGKSADHRADLFAFGAVLFEMLSGARAFTGASAVEMMNAILTVDPLERRSSSAQWPPALESLIRHCLEKEPDERFQSARDLGFQLQSIATGSGPSAATAIASTRRRTRWTMWAAGIALLLVGAVAGWGVTAWRRPSAASRSPVTFNIAPPDGVTVARYASIARAGMLSVSPDGQKIAFIGTRADGSNQLFVRFLDSLEAKPIEGTTGASYPFWSPDSAHVAFCSGGRLRRTATAGGPVEVITACTNARSSGSWGRDDTILFAPVFNSPLVRVSASGGAATDLNLERTSTQRDAFFSPVWLPDGQRFLVVRFPFDDSAAASSGVYLGQLGSPTLTPVVPGRVSEVTLDGDALIMRRGEELISQPFDIATGRVSGSPHTLAQRVIAMSAAGGTLVYHAPPQGASLGSRITWVSRDRGATLFETGTPGSINDLRLSRDGRVLAATRIGEFGLAEIWTYDLKRNVDQRVSSGGTIVPVWSDDPRYVTGLGPDGVRRFDLTALGAPPQLILPTTSADTTLDWSPDGKHVALRLISTLASPRPRVMVYPVGGADTKGNGDPVTIAEPSGPGAGIVAFSPNGKWIAYTDAQSGGRPRVYVSAFPLRGDRVTVSSMDATHMRWRRDGRELFILTGGPQFGTSGSQFGSARIFAIDVIENDKGIDFGPARELFTLNKILRGTSAFDVSPDGQQFVFIIPSDPDRTPLTVIRDRVSR